MILMLLLFIFVGMPLIDILSRVPKATREFLELDK